MAKENDLQERVQALEHERQMFFDVAYKSYTELAAVAQECRDPEAARKIGDAITELGMLIGRTETRVHPR